MGGMDGRVGGLSGGYAVGWVGSLGNGCVG